MLLRQIPTVFAEDHGGTLEDAEKGKTGIHGGRHVSRLCKLESLIKQ
jgi:hypothetical protein